MASQSVENYKTNDEHLAYSVPEETARVFRDGILLNPLISKDLPPEVTAQDESTIRFTGSDIPSLPVNWKYAEAVSSLKGLEASIVNALLQRRYGIKPQSVTIKTDHAALFLFSAMLWTIDPGEGGENIKADNLRQANEALFKYLPSYDKHGMSSSIHRSLATNIYRCEDGRFFHSHASLDPMTTLKNIDLEPDMTAASYEEGLKPFFKAFGTLTSEEMQHRTDESKQAGTICYTVDEFLQSEHGQANQHVGLWEIHDMQNPKQSPSWWPLASSQAGPSRPLAGLKVVDLTRIIAGPCITRSLAELGASVMRCTAAHLPDICALHADLNWGKWNCHIDLRSTEGQEKLRALIQDADVVVQGYRPGALDKYGFGQDDILKLCENRERGIIYVRENSYGWHGPWKDRSGWQQIADANTGLSHSFGQAMGHGEPVTPIFPHSDYCTGIAGSCAILLALLRRAEKGGSYCIDLALNYYSTWLIKSVGTYPDEVFDHMWAENGRPIYHHWHNNGVTLPETLWRLRNGPGGKRLFNPEFFEDRSAPGILGEKKIRCVKPVAEWEGVVKLGFNVGTRGNGVDAPCWPDDLSQECIP
ncbi:Acetyl-coenzyme A transferase nodX [Cladobotryum mycophilum]|uniref:Acetyl-coenzyme A transferase nodX n=1 Tax=Cladobotryum mycophilum TaxID=491253 RepID=A0ABR0S667_9HYPO